MTSSVVGDRQIKIGLVFLGRKRPGFDHRWGQWMEDRVRQAVRQTGFQVFEPPEKAVDDGAIRRAAAACECANASVLILLQTTMADGRLAPTMAQLWPDPLILWATPENPEGDMISSCSLVGAHVWGSTLRQMGRPMDIVYGHPDHPETKRRLEEAVRLAATIRRLRSVRVGVVGGQAPGFFAMSADPFSIHRGLGAQVQTFGLTEFAEWANGVSDQAVADDVAEVKALGLEHKDTSDEDLPMASRLYLAMRRCMADENIDALSVRCWPEMPNTFGQWPYLGMARLADAGCAIACEGDVDGALSAWIGEHLGMGRCYLSDWLEHDDQTVTLWHGGAAPMSLSPSPGHSGAPRIARHFNNKKPAVLEATIREGMPITIFRLWRFQGVYQAAACAAQTLKPRRHLMGTNALARLLDRQPGEWFDELCYRGMPHHVAVFPGHHVALVQRLARIMQIDVL